MSTPQRETQIPSTVELNIENAKTPDKKHKLKLAHQNINWLSNKIDRLAHFLQDENPDLVILTEHGLTQENLEKTCLEGYFLVGGFARTAHLKGGVAGYAKKGLEKNIKLIQRSENESELICEIATFEIKLTKEIIQVLGVYRPPNSKLDDAIDILTEQLNSVSTTYKQTIIMGDINVDNLTDNSDNKKIEDLLATYGIVRISLPPTRITKDTSKSIDWICTNITTENLTTAVIPSGLSDHTAQTATINAQAMPLNLNKEMKRTFTKRETDAFKEELKAENWTNVLTANDVNQAYNNFHNTIQHLLNTTCPVKPVKGKKRQKRKFWDEECTRLKGEYLNAVDQEQRTGRAEDKAETAIKKKNYDLKLKALRKECNSAHIEQSENKSKALWQVINNERKPNPKTDSQLILQINNKLVKEPCIIADSFNNFFATIAERSIKTNGSNVTTVHEVEQTVVNHSMTLWPTTLEEVTKAIKSLKPKTSSGIDEISAKLVKKCMSEITIPITDIINKSFTQGIFPAQLKTSKIYPKYKSGPKTETNSYRPISLISTFSKIIEKIALERLLIYLEQHDLLTSQQHGFLKGRSTATALIQLTEYIIDQLEEGCTATSLFLDFSKAFDCLNHDQLLQKLTTLGIKGKEWEWFSSYLKGRKQLVEITSTKDRISTKTQSGTADIKRGVPQGSVLGPVLFLLLTNDMPDGLQEACHTVMYADDTVLTLANKTTETLQQHLNTQFHQTKEYCLNNDLILNEQKTVQLIFNTRNRHTEPITLPNVEIKETTKYLGITIDSKLSWRPHIDALCKKLSSGTYVIRRIKQVCDQNTAKVAYYALFESHLRYGIATWGGTSRGNMDRVLIQQKRAIRCLAGLQHRDACQDAFRQLKILTAVSLYIREVTLHAVNSQQARHQDFHQYNTRHTSNFALPPHHLTLFTNKPSYKGALFYNHLPEHLKNAPPQHFKNQLTKWLQERPFHSEKEFLDSRQNNLAY